MQFLKSPGGITPSSRLRRPELPPSSATPMIAVRLSVCCLSPFSRTDIPVPPPITTIFGPFSLDKFVYRASLIFPKVGISIEMVL